MMDRLDKSWREQDTKSKNFSVFKAFRRSFWSALKSK